MIRNELSILLPVYNTRCLTMVERLKKLCDAVDGLQYEIIAADDGSTDKDAVAFNRSIDRMEGCRYVVRAENKGAAATRNFLADISRYAWLLFLDCDMALPDDRFIIRYLEAPEAGVVIGGIRTGGTADDVHRSHGDILVQLPDVESVHESHAVRLQNGLAQLLYVQSFGC